MHPSPSDAFPKSYGVIPIKGDQVYLVKHANGGHWGFPKGRADGDELPLDAAKRELVEETGLKFEELLFEEPLIEDRQDKTVYLYIAIVSGKGSPQLDDVTEGKWVSFQELETTLTYKEAKAVATKLMQQLEKYS